MTLRFSAPKVLGLPGLPVWMDRPKIASIMKLTGWEFEKVVTKLRTLSMAQIEALINAIDVEYEEVDLLEKSNQNIRKVLEKQEAERKGEKHETREETCLPIDSEPLSGEPIEVGEEQSGDVR